MIFVTVGEQLPYDRLIRAVDSWAEKSTLEVFAQIGRTSFRPQNIAFKDFLSQEEYKEKFLAAHLIVAHAGMGTIISAIEFRKPLLVMPRQALLGEVRSDHQFASARRFAALDYVLVALNEVELLQKLDEFNKLSTCAYVKKNTDPAPLLIKTILNFIES